MISRFPPLFLTALLFCVVGQNPLADNALADAARTDEQNAVRQAIESVFDEAKVSRIRPSAVPGLYEVLVGTEVIYASGDGRYILRGDLIDLQARINLSENQRSQARQAMLKAVPVDDLVTFAAEHKKHAVYVFTDTTCGYCRKLHQDVAELNRRGVDVHYLAFPRTGVGSPAYREMAAVWCSEDQNAAMTRAKAGGMVTASTCANPVQAHYELGHALGVRGTPTIYLEDGTSLPGYVPPQVLLQELQQSTAD